jgi:hypothetical protein
MTLTRLKAVSHLVPPAGTVRDGDYLTDGCRLFRVAAPCGDGRKGSLVEVEDCATLDVWLMTPAELASLHPVRPASGSAVG